MVDVSGFSPKDAKIIRENEGKTPYELAELGLSNKAYERLLSGDTTAIKEKPTTETGTKNIVDNTVKPKSVTPIDNKAKVQLTAPAEYKKQRAKANAGTVTVLNKRTGRTTKMPVSYANRLLKNPKAYQIV